VNSYTNFPLQGIENEAKKVGKYKRPALIIWGNHDVTVAFSDCFEKWEKYFVYGHKRIINNTKHAPFLERIDDVNNLILQFVTDKMHNDHIDDTKQTKLI